MERNGNAYECELDQLLENEKLTKVLLAFLDFKAIYRLAEMDLSMVAKPKYKVKGDDVILRKDIPGVVKKLHQLIHEKIAEKAYCEGIVLSDGGDCGDLNRLKNEVVLLPLLFENLIHGACEIPWSQEFVISENWEIIANGESELF